ncbi:SPRY domain-containing protein 3-like isoform X1 [Oncorhynchus nerka]|uniref:SPRY domain-containing protein 3-like isoform X1 n=1 Tax=Oncorhynchus nerka TaxID=8023 RepID=UPI0031B8005F
MDEINPHYRFMNWRRRIREVRAVRYRERFKRMMRDGEVLSYQGNSDEVGCYVAPRPLSKGNCYFELLEYMGKGKSIVDVGLAQARLPLNTRCHYYELEITDAGEKCYIALGLARRDYPKNRHPGWSRGSIAYHADDGKLFQGSGVGDAFGPRCFEGDVMGCGIMFPRDYILDSGDERDDGDPELRPKQQHVQNDLYMNDEDEEEDGEELEGRKVVVFFTRNGKVVGRKEVAVPAGGFYPTIGMMSTGEKVRVDLHPLSG